MNSVEVNWTDKLDVFSTYLESLTETTETNVGY